MIKKKAKSQAIEKTARKKGSAKKKKEMNPLEVRKEIAEMVESEATVMAKAVIEEGKKGQLATVKYLFEVAEIYPPATNGGQGTPEEDSFAKTLMQRLNIPDKPIVQDDDEDEGSDAPSSGTSGAAPASVSDLEEENPGSSVGDERKDSELA